MRAKSLALFLAAGFCALFSSVPTQAQTIGQAAPAYVSPRLDGSVFDLASLKGKVDVLHFWATWCAPCREEMPALEGVWRHYHNQGFEVLAISGDRPRARGDVDQVMHYFTFPASMLSAATKNDFGVPSSVPTTYVIAKDGVIDAVLTPELSPLTETGLGDEVKKLLEAKTEAKVEPKPDVKP